MPDLPESRRADLLAAVRLATSSSHRRLEENLLILDRLRSPDRRQELMAAFYGFYVPVESMLQPLLGRLPGLDFEQRSKIAHLERDLADLGLSPAAIAGLPLCSVPRPGDTAMAMGLAYVTEGASLGGKVIRRQAETAGLSQTGLSFFGCYEPDTADMWRRFCAVLEAVGQAPAASSQVIRGAVAGFEAIDQWFDQRLGK